MITRVTDGSFYNQSEFYFKNKLLCFEDIDGLKEEALLAVRVSDVLSPLAYRYLYDGANNITEKKIPDAEKMEYIYDTRNLPTGMRDGNLRFDNNWMVTQYDTYGRPTKTGLHADSAIPDGTANLPIDGNAWTQTYYDGVSPLITNRTDPQYVGKVSHSTVAILDGNTATDYSIPTIFEYDSFGRVTTQRGNHHMHVLQNPANSEVFSKILSTYTYDWSDNITEDARLLINNIAGDTRTITNQNYFDH